MTLHLLAALSALAGCVLFLAGLPITGAAAVVGAGLWLMNEDEEDEGET